MEMPRALIIRDGTPRSDGSGGRHALVVASPSTRRSGLVQALRASGFDVVVESLPAASADWVGDPLLELVVLDLSPAGLRALGALGSEGHVGPGGPRVVLVTGVRESDEGVERALSAAASENGTRIRHPGDPGRYGALVEQAKAHILARDFPSALALLEEAVDVDDRRPEAYNLLGVIADVRGARSEAQVHWRIATLVAPDYRPARANLRRQAQVPRMRTGLELG